MTSRKIKHARMLEHRAEFFRNVKEGNYNVLSKVRSQREAEEQKAAQELKDKKVEKSKRLAKANKAKPAKPQEA